MSEWKAFSYQKSEQHSLNHIFGNGKELCDEKWKKGKEKELKAKDRRRGGRGGKEREEDEEENIT